MIVGAAAQKGGHAVQSSDLLKRTGSAAVLLAVAFVAAYLGGIAAGVVAGAFALAVLLEWGKMTGATSARSLPFFAVLVSIAVVVSGFGMIATGCIIALAAAIAAAAYTGGIWLPAGVIYGSVLGIGLVALRLAPEFGLEALIFLLAVVWATDSGAFFAGRTIGGPKLVPQISPQKTWAGAIGGAVAAVAAGFAAAWLAGIPVTLALISIALLLSVACQLGDLFESWVKRRFGAKDSGTTIPGHGGVMDRVDGLTFAAFAAVVIGAAHDGPGSLGRGLVIW